MSKISLKRILFKGAENKFSYLEYDELLDLNREFSFNLLQKDVSSEADFEIVKEAAKKALKEDLIRFGECFYEIAPGLRNKLMGTIGALVLVTQTDGKVKVRFHKRNNDGIWNDVSKTYPENFLSQEDKDKEKFKYEIFFTLEDVE